MSKGEARFLSREREISPIPHAQAKKPKKKETQKLGFRQARCRTDQTQSQIWIFGGKGFQSFKKARNGLEFEYFSNNLYYLNLLGFILSNHSSRSLESLILVVPSKNLSDSETFSSSWLWDFQNFGRERSNLFSSNIGTGMTEDGPRVQYFYLKVGFS